ncbi:MAG: S41 family peptidase [Candidatus Coprovivens sp.]
MKKSKEIQLDKSTSSKSNTIIKDEKKNKNNDSNQKSNVFLDKLFKKRKSVFLNKSGKNSKRKKKKKNNKKYSNGRFSLDIFDLLIMVVIVAIISCVCTGLILNYQYQKNYHYLYNDAVSDKKVQEFLDTYSEVVDNYYEEVDKDAMIEAALEGMLDFLKDNYSIFLDKNETDMLSESLDGTYEGIGIVVMSNVVYQVYDNSPADKVGIKANDEIISINGTEITSENYTIIADLLNKDKENEVIVKRDNVELTFYINVDEVEIPSVESDIIFSEDKSEKIGYLFLSSFSSHSFEDFQESLLKLENDEIDSLIIDLRNNSGGYLNSATDIASLFLKKGEVLYSLESKNNITTYKDETKDKREYKIVILVNSNTASAAEILTAALKDSYGATIVGKTTFGKGKVQTMKYYEDTMIKYTSAKWLRPNGECIDEIGIVPDYDVDIQYGNNVIYDLQLDKAIKLLS